MGNPLEHPVPQELLIHIGDIIVSFALLTLNIQLLIGSLIQEHQRIGQIITAELSFKNLRALAISLYKERHGEDADFTTLRELMHRADDLEGKRNTVMHSTWAAGDTVDIITRLKTKAKQKHGLVFASEDMGEKELAAIALDIKTLAAEIQGFWLHLMEQGKAINNPLQKTW